MIHQISAWRGHSSLSAQLSPAAIGGYGSVLICCQTALLSRGPIPFYFISFPRQGFDHGLDTEEESGCFSPMSH